MWWQSSSYLGTRSAGDQHDRRQETLPTKSYCVIRTVGSDHAVKVPRPRIRAEADPENEAGPGWRTVTKNLLLRTRVNLL